MAGESTYLVGRDGPEMKEKSDPGKGALMSQHLLP